MSYFFALCAGGGCTIICCHFHMYRDNWVLFPLLLFRKRMIAYIMARGSHSFVCTLNHITIFLMQTYMKVLNLYNACQVHSVECVSKIKPIPSSNFHAIFEALCIQLTRFSCYNWDNKCTFSYYNYQIESMNRLPLCGVRLWSNGMRCMSFYVRMDLLWYPSYILWHTWWHNIVRNNLYMWYPMRSPLQMCPSYKTYVEEQIPNMDLSNGCCVYIWPIGFVLVTTWNMLLYWLTNRIHPCVWN